MTNRGSTLSAGNTLSVGDYLLSPGGHFCAVLQDNGDIGVYRGCWPDRLVGPLWWTGIGRAAGQYPADLTAKLGTDGRLVTYSGTKIMWQSDPAPAGGASAVASMQDDGNFTLAVPGNTYWSTGTNRGAIFVHSTAAFVTNVHTNTGGDTGNFPVNKSGWTTWPLDTRAPKANFFISPSKTPFDTVDLGTVANQRFRVSGTTVHPKAEPVSGFGPF
ncbi:MAG: hypothetical protein ABWX96_02015 [Propionibacteriaceae bacterium]